MRFRDQVALISGAGSNNSAYVTAAEQAAEIARTPLRRIAQSEDQARMICFLASADADFVTEVTIDVTGGQ